MSYEEGPSLHESDVEVLATSKVFARGRELFDDGVLEELARQPISNGAELNALCQGSDDEPYALSVQVTVHGVQETRCSCPYEYDGLCKHLVALLLAWAHTPEVFAEAEVPVSEPVTESALFLDLRNRERDELAQIIVQLVEADPKLRPLLRQLIKSRLSEDDVAKTEKAVATLVRKVLHHGFEGSFSQIRRELLFHVRSAASVASLRSGDAIKLYSSILRGLMAAGEEPIQWDEDGHIVDISHQCVAALAELLPDASTSARRVALDALCQAYLFEIRLGGYGFAEGAEEILEKANAEEWELLEPQLDVFAEYRSPSEWGKTQILALKAKRITQLEGVQAANDFLIQHGTPEQQVEAHLATGNFEEAVRLAGLHFAYAPGLIHSFADKLNAVGQWERARQWAEAHQMTRWLAQQSALRGEPDALPLNITLFYAEPSVQQWTETLELALEPAREELRAQLWQFLEKKQAFVVQFDICSREGDVQAALDIWPKLSVGARQERYEKLATAAESHDADIAVVMWSELAESLIDQRSRKAYSHAANALVRAKKVLEKAGRGDEWPPMRAALRARYPTLRALEEELDCAKL